MTSQSPADDIPTEGYMNAWKSISYMVQFERASWSSNERNCIYLNLGDGRFTNVSAASGSDYPQDGRAVAACDWNDDGRQDLVLRSRSTPRLRLLENRLPDTGHFLSLELAQPVPNMDAIGAKIFVEAGGRKLRRTIRAGEGYLAQSSRRATIGLGDAKVAERVRVVWPDGSEEEFQDVAADRHLRLQKGTGKLAQRPHLVPGTELPAADLGTEQPAAQRVVLGYKLPMGPIRLPGFASPTRRVENLAGGVVLVNLWATWCQACRVELGEFAAERDRIQAAGITIVPMCTDGEGPELAKARKLMQELGFADVAGYADGATKREFEALILEVLGNFDSVPMPTSFLLDRAGQLVAIYFGPPGLEQLLEDAAVVSDMATNYGFNGRLLGGRWALRQIRDFTSLGAVFDALGRPDAAALYRRLAEPPTAPDDARDNE